MEAGVDVAACVEGSGEAAVWEITPGDKTGRAAGIEGKKKKHLLDWTYLFSRVLPVREAGRSRPCPRQVEIYSADDVESTSQAVLERQKIIVKLGDR